MPKYPPTPAGRRITAGLLQSMLPEVIVKTVTTERDNTFTTLQDDPDLTTDLEANAVYLVEFVLYFAGIQAADIRTEWTVPPGAAGLKSVLGPASTATDPSSPKNADGIVMRVGVHQWDTDIVYAAIRDSGGLAFLVQEQAVVTTSAAGTCAIRWCQASANATASQLYAGSYMRVTRIG